LVVPVHGAPPSRLRQRDPVGAAIAGTGEPPAVHQRFRQQGPVAVAPLPVGGSWRAQCARILLASPFTGTHGRIRKRLLLTMKGKFRARSASLQPIQRSRAAIFQAALVHCKHASTRSPQCAERTS